MSTDTVISVTGLSKKYCRSLKRTMVYGIRDVASEMLGLCSSSSRLRRDEFWALDEVSFEITRGECVGLIGANGAGKSTLLKLVNGITLPDKGSLMVNGRVGALIELGAGFHPLLTGRENIHLSGAILGCSKAQMAERFDSIVDFAGLEEFIDSPVKQYSTGMYVRLGFAVAISSEPDILIVDESIAVGDMAFRNRCLDRIRAFIKAGKTIIVVSHNLQEIEKIAQRALLLDHGIIRADGRPDEVISSYMNLLHSRQPQQQWRDRDGKVDGIQLGPVIEIVKVEVCGKNGEKKNYFRTHDELCVVISFIAHQPVINPVFRVQIFRYDGLFCHGMNTERHGVNYGEVFGEGSIKLRYADLSLLGGDYSVHVAVLSSQYDAVPLHQMTNSISIHLESQMIDGAGVFAMPTEWTSIAD